jgi:hypothetical protein
LSYCRRSTDSFRCDLHAYADCGGGWTIYIARNRSVDPPTFPRLSEMGETEESRAEWYVMPGRTNE